MERQVRGVPIYYEEQGEGRPILMLHGWPLDHRVMTYFLEPVFAARAGWRRIYPDLPGMGRTPGSDAIACQDDMLDIVLDFLDSVVPDQRTAIVGASYGGYLARGLIRRRAALISGAMLWAPVGRPKRADRQLPPYRRLVHDPAVTALVSDDEKDWLTLGGRADSRDARRLPQVDQASPRSGRRGLPQAPRAALRVLVRPGRPA